jgi:hypothetical protein
MNLEKKKKLYPNLFNIQKPLKPIVGFLKENLSNIETIFK